MSVLCFEDCFLILFDSIDDPCSALINTFVSDIPINSSPNQDRRFRAVSGKDMRIFLNFATDKFSKCAGKLLAACLIVNDRCKPRLTLVWYEDKVDFRKASKCPLRLNAVTSSSTKTDCGSALDEGVI